MTLQFGHQRTIVLGLSNSPYYLTMWDGWVFLPTLSFPFFESSKEKSIQSTKMYNTVTFYQLIATACPESLR